MNSCSDLLLNKTYGYQAILCMLHYVCLEKKRNKVYLQ